MRHGAAGEHLADQGVEIAPVAHPQLLGLEARIGQPPGLPQHLAEALPVAFARGAQVEHAVAGGEQPHGAAGGMVVAFLRGHVAVVQVARRLEIHHGDLRMQQRGMHPLPLPGLLAFEQRGQDADGGVQAGAGIGHRQPGAHRPLAGQPGHRHQAAHALRDLVEAGPAGIRAALPEAGNAGQDDARVDGAQRFIIHAQARFHVRAPVLHHHVGAGHQAPEHRHPFGLFQVERQRPLVAVQVLEIAAPAVGGEHRLVGIDARRRFDPDHVRAEIGQHAHTGRAGPHARQVQDAEALQCRRCG
ncbi:Uncharacterised protein [Bordetella pertussis]|nr:Uncharacterised protein [Bordetella pertussis]